MWLAVTMAGIAHAGCESWTDCRVAAELHPVSIDYGLQYQQALEQTMAGRQASPLFNGVVNEAEVHWRLLDASGRGLGFGEGKPTEWRDLALVGSFLAFNRVMDQTFARAPALDAIRLVLDAAVSPSVDLVFREDGRLRAKHATGWEVGQRFQAAQDEAGFERSDAENDDEAVGSARTAASSFRGTGSRRERQRPPMKLHFGLGWRVRDEEQPETDPLLTWNAHLSMNLRAGTLVRADWSLLHDHWESLARQRLFDGVSAEATLRSEDESPVPRRWATGLLWNPADRWTVRLRRSQGIVDDTWVDNGNWEVMLTVRAELGGRLPGRLEPSLAGLPAVDDRSPNELVPAWAWVGAERPD
jgi:hypothetical protein